jgi:hypothetical protein
LSEGQAEFFLNHTLPPCHYRGPFCRIDRALAAGAVVFDWIAAILGLAAFGILVMAGLQYHHELCHVPRENE